jgi:hypothetical protein
MKPYFLNSDINVLCVTASSFPDGIMAAFDKLNSLIQSPAPKGFLVFRMAMETKTLFTRRRSKKIRQMKRPGWDVRDSQLKKVNTLVSILKIL